MRIYGDAYGGLSTVIGGKKFKLVGQKPSQDIANSLKKHYKQRGYLVRVMHNKDAATGHKWWVFVRGELK